MVGKASFIELCRYLAEIDSAILSAHISPDADAVGATCALALGLKQLGKRVKVYLSDPVPERMSSFVSGVDIVSNIPADAYQAVVVVDTASKRRVGREYETLCAKGETVVVIDHHISNDMWGDINFIDGDKPSSASIVLEILEQLAVRFDSQIANLLFAGLLEDTGCFRFSNTTSQAFDSASRLVEHGAVPEVVSNHLYFSQPHRVLRLRSRAMESLELFADGYGASVSVSKELQDSLGARSEDTEGIVDEVRSISGTVCAVFFRELDAQASGGAWKVSLRSKLPELDVNAIAGTFGGGGHRAAAGCTLLGSFPDVKAQVLEKVSAAISALRKK